MKTITLHCHAGNHDWERPAIRGRRPLNCPAHDGITVAKPAEAISLESVEVVETFRAWLRADRLHYTVPRSERKAAAPRCPKLPSTTDYDHARAYAAL